MDIADIVLQTIYDLIAKYNGASLEQINDELIIKGLELGFLDLLKKEYTDLTPLLMGYFDYDYQTELFTIKKEFYEPHRCETPHQVLFTQLPAADGKRTSDHHLR